ncbi:MAG: ACT domain-containing protein [Promethearchaeota archaeon]
MKDITVILENVPGKLADLGEILGKNGINMEGICGFPIKDEGIIHILVEDEIKTRKILEQAGFLVSAVREVLVLTGQPGKNILIEPGTGGKIARKISNAGVNIDLIYFAALNRLIIGVDNIEKAKAALK